MLKKTTITNNFSRFATKYNEYAIIQKRTAYKLLNAFAMHKEINTILEIGCGTGTLTKLLLECFSCAQIDALDIAQGMIDYANISVCNDRVSFILGDAEEYTTNKKYDLIISHATLQWLMSIEKTLQRYHPMLSPDGDVIFSLFGPNTFCELNKVMKEFFGNDTRLTSEVFPSSEKIEIILGHYFKNPQCIIKTITQEYRSISDLLSSIKYTGTQGAGVKTKGLWTPNIITQLDGIYRKLYKGIYVTYEVFYCKGGK